MAPLADCGRIGLGCPRPPRGCAESVLRAPETAVAVSRRGALDGSCGRDGCGLRLVQERRHRIPLGCAGRLADREVQQQAVAVLHQGMAHKRQPGFLARPLAQQMRLGVRGAGVRLVASALSAEIHGRVARIVVRGRRRSLLGAKAPGLAAASIRVPSTLKCSSDSSPSSSAAQTTSSNRAWPASCASSRCRFLVKTVASKLRSIRSMSRNQRQGRLYPAPRRRRARCAPSRGRSGARPSAASPAAPRPGLPTPTGGRRSATTVPGPHRPLP